MTPVEMHKFAYPNVVPLTPAYIYENIATKQPEAHAEAVQNTDQQLGSTAVGQLLEVN